MGNGIIIRSDSTLNVHKGNNNLSGLYSGYISGSGNYVSFFVPCAYDRTITSCAISNSGGNSDLVTYTPTNNTGANTIDFSYCTITKKETGLQIELKFTVIQTPNTCASVAVSDNISFNFS